jgi:hypothetical protein
MKKKKQASKTKRPTSQYDLATIRTLIDEEKVLIRPNAERSAFDDFGWGIDDVKGAITKLKPKHFHKTADHNKIPGIVLDFYKARGIKNENIYTHFYIDSKGFLIISSIKKL